MLLICWQITKKGKVVMGNMNRNVGVTREKLKEFGGYIQLDTFEFYAGYYFYKGSVSWSFVYQTSIAGIA